MEQIRLVEFKNGKFGIEKISILSRMFGGIGKFKDLVSQRDLWWPASSQFFIESCQSNDMAKVVDIYLAMTNPIKRVVDLSKDEYIQRIK